MIPPRKDRLAGAQRALELKIAGKTWREIDARIAKEMPEAHDTAVLDAMYRLAHIDEEDWLPEQLKYPLQYQVGRPAHDRYHGKMHTHDFVPPPGYVEHVLDLPADELPRDRASWEEWAADSSRALRPRATSTCSP